MANTHIVLLGDSIFDNESYVGSGLSVHRHLTRHYNRPEAKVTLRALDGAVIASVAHQLVSLPDDTTHLVLSVGGNDALRIQATILPLPASTVAESLSLLQAAIDDFERQYRRLAETLQATQLPVTVCTIYDCVPGLADASRAGLAAINSVITRIAFEFGFDLLDLRLLCGDNADYAAVSPIEPSHIGGGKIAAAIRAMCEDTAGSRVYATPA